MASGKCALAGINNKYEMPTHPSGITVCQRRSPVLSECHPLLRSPYRPAMAGNRTRNATLLLGSPERRLMNGGNQKTTDALLELASSQGNRRNITRRQRNA